jgi:FeoB-associated Cys-rich membrane protein
MDWQLVVAILLVVAAAGYLGRQAWRTWTAKKGGCAGGCGCGKAAGSAEGNGQAAIIPSEQITLRRRGG